MILDINYDPQEWKQDVYIASKTGVTYDEDGNEIPTYDKPNEEPYQFNVQPVNTDVDIAEFGEKASIMKKMVIPIAYKETFKELDVAYLDGATPKDEQVNGANANYKLLPPRNGNAVIIIFLEKLIGK